MNSADLIRLHIVPYWRTFIVVLVPLLLSPLPIIWQTKAASTAYVIVMMAIFWMTEALPLAVTSLMPVALFPMFGVMSTGASCTAYMKDSNMMFLAGLILASAIENCQLHKRIALRALTLSGSSYRWLLLGFMLVTMFLSMWISNTAATAMMVPIVDAVLKLFERDLSVNDATELGIAAVSSQQSIISKAEEANLEDGSKGSDGAKQFRICFFLGIAYSASIGGTGSLIGSGTQLAFKGILEDMYGNKHGLNFATWMAFNVPGMLINTFFAWIWLQLLFIGFKKSDRCQGTSHVKKILRQKYDELGAISFQESAVLVLFGICILLWFFRDPKFISGWAHLLPAVKINDATVAMIIVLLMFIVPAKLDFWCFRNKAESGPPVSGDALLNWKFVQQKLPWGIVLLLGSGYAISEASKVSGLSSLIGKQLVGLNVLPPFAIIVIICCLAATLTEFASNVATANILLPILAEMAKSIKVNPLMLMLPTTVSCSYAFMFPAATPSNAIVYTAADMKMIHMVKAGIVMNFVCIIVICVLTETLGGWMFDIHHCPDWVTQVKAEANTSLAN